VFPPTLIGGGIIESRAQRQTVAGEIPYLARTSGSRKYLGSVGFTTVVRFNDVQRFTAGLHKKHGEQVKSLIHK
jgi:hypothetical protein